MTPEAKLPASPSAAVRRGASSRSHAPAASAAPKAPHTEVACQPRAWKTPEAAMPRRVIASYPATAAVIALRPSRSRASASASTVGRITAEAWVIDAAWVSWVVPVVPRLVALPLVLLVAGCAPAGRGEAPSAPTARANDFRAAQVRQAVVLVRVVVASTSELSERDRKDLPALYESALLEALDARAILVRDVRSVEARGAVPETAAAAARAREVGVDHALVVSLRVEPDVVRVCEETRRPMQGRATVWRQEARVVRAADGGERPHAPVTTPDGGAARATSSASRSSRGSRGAAVPPRAAAPTARGPTCRPPAPEPARAAAGAARAAVRRARGHGRAAVAAPRGTPRCPRSV